MPLLMLGKNMDANLEDQILIIKASIDNNNKATGKTYKDTDYKLDNIEKQIEKLIDKLENSSPNIMETRNPKDCAAVVHGNRKFTSLEGGNFNTIGIMWTLKHDISSPK